MQTWIIALMIGGTSLLGVLALAVLLWGVREGQFEDKGKFIDGARWDSEEDLEEYVLMEQKRQNAKKTDS